MEAETLPKKKTTISKGKIKKSIKNVLCRPDPAFWPTITENHGIRLIAAMNKYKVPIPEFKKPNWKELKLIPKDKRPKPPVIKKIDGLLFGISECSTAIQNKQCSAIIIESNVNPRSLVQPILEGCITANIPILCLNDLRKTSFDCFGITTSCLGVRSDSLLDLNSEISDISRNYVPQVLDNDSKALKMEIDVAENPQISNTGDSCLVNNSKPEFMYLYRTNKKSRIFVPSEAVTANYENKFIGQDFIEFTGKQERKPESKEYMKMIVKRISNNPKRVAKK